MNQSKSRTTTYLFVAVLLIAVVTSLTPQGRQYLTSISSSVGAAATDSRYEITVTLNTEYGDAFEWRAPISKNEYREAEMTKKHIVRRYAGEAKKALARKMGYYDSLYGSDNDKLANVQLAKVTVADLRADSETDLIVRQ